MPKEPEECVVPPGKTLSLKIEVFTPHLVSASVKAKFKGESDYLPTENLPPNTFNVDLGESNNVDDKLLKCAVGVTVSDPTQKPEVKYTISDGEQILCQGRIGCELAAQTTFKCMERFKFQLEKPDDGGDDDQNQ